MKVGFIGLGRMGKGMAHRIQGGDHELTVFDVVREATTEFAAAGARGADSIADVCKGNEVVLTMLVEDSAVIEVVLDQREEHMALSDKRAGHGDEKVEPSRSEARQ